MCSPIVWGSKSYFFLINVLSVTLANGKKAPHVCNCGHLGDARCRCTPDQVARYRARISGPLLDRIDIQIEVPAIPTEELQRRGSGESSNDVRIRVETARARMLARQGKQNAMLASREVEQHCAL